VTARALRSALAGAALGAVLSGCVPAVVVGGIAATAVVVTDRRTTGAQVDDQVIEDKTALTLNERFKGGEYHINVTSYNGIVLLTGEVPAESAKTDIEQIVRSTPKVRAVQDELVVGAAASLASRSNDTATTAKVKTRFADTNKFQATQVKVVTERGVVYLMGIVRRDEGDAAAQIASTTDGVQRVVKVFEYVPG
jgi:osmotically-inducible protein OsmY